MSCFLGTRLWGFARRSLAFAAAFTGLAGCGSTTGHDGGLAGAGGSGADSGNGGQGGGGQDGGGQGGGGRAGGGQGGGGQAGGGQGGGGQDGGGAPRFSLYRDFYGLAFGNGKLVATGSESAVVGDSLGEARGVIYSSSDGVTWDRVATDLAAPPRDVSYGNGRFVAVGSQIAPDSSGQLTRFAQAFVSADGEEWTTVDLVDPLTAFRSAFGNDLFVAAGSTAHWRSSDGSSWTPFGPAHDLMGGVEFGNGRFVSWVPGATEVLGSTGEDWTAVTASDKATFGLFDLNVVNDRFVGVTRSDCCSGEVPEAIRWGRVSSVDGLSWTTEATGLTGRPGSIVVEDAARCIAFLGTSVLSGPDCDSLEVSFSEQKFIGKAALYAGGRYLVTSTLGLLSSSDGTNWSKLIWSE